MSSRRSSNHTKAWVREREQDRLAGLSAKRRAARMSLPSKVAGGLSRKNVLADEPIFRAIATSLNTGRMTVLGRGRRPLVQKQVRDTFVFKTDETLEDGTTERTIWTPDWTHTGERLKLLAMGAGITGEKATLNINLAPAQIEAALRSPRGFVGYFTERMGRALKAAGDETAQYVFIVEGAEAQDFHLHGVISSTVPNLRGVLAAVGGKTSKAAPERQVHSRSVYSLVGWVRYIAKAPLTTAEVMTYERLKLGFKERQDGLIGAARSTRARGKIWYEAARRSREPIHGFDLAEPGTIVIDPRS